MSSFARLKARARHRAVQARDVPAARRLRFALAADAVERFSTARPFEAEPLRVLDAGGGDGLLAEALARRHPEWLIVAGDLDSDRLEMGRRRLGPDLHNVEFARMDLTRDLGEAAYDVVLAIECLEEIDDDDAALGAMARALRPGGLLAVHVPERDWRPLLPGSESSWRHEVRHGYGAAELGRKLNAAGLEVRTIRPVSHALVRLAQEARDRNRDRGPRLQLMVYPAAVAAAALERRGVRLGSGRALYAEGYRAVA
jgi:SAM-dependent methyltransferase